MPYITVLSFLLPALTFLNAETCPGWFGTGCMYKCHCSKDSPCDVVGNCNGQCNKGWFGPECQYADLVHRYSKLDLPPWSNKNSDITSCPSITSENELTIEFNESLPFTWMRLQHRNPKDGFSFEVQFSESTDDKEERINCINENKSIVSNTTIDIHCNLEVRIRRLFLSGNSMTSLCSAYVSGGRNVALRQKTSQSSTDESGDSKRAVDGNTSGKYVDDESCTHTENKHSEIHSWNVSFVRPVKLNRYILYNRQDSDCNKRLQGFVLESYSDKQGKDLVFSHSDNMSNSVKNVYHLTTSNVTQMSPIFMVTVQLHKSHGEDHILTLCEVETYGDSVCNLTYHGRECEHRCFCLNDDPCFVSTGRCPSGCAPGFRGDTCNNHCELGKFGQNCTQSCNPNCHSAENEKISSPCHHVNGTCLFGCYSGFKGNQCQTHCELGKFGQNCTQSCNPNCHSAENEKISSPCHHVNGTCLFGCYSGFKGNQCQTPCELGKFGHDCAQSCNPNCLSGKNENVSSSCHHVNGTCHFGCHSGFKGSQCQTRREAHTATKITATTASIMSVILAALIIIGLFVWRRRKHTERPDHLNTESGENDHTQSHRRQLRESSMAFKATQKSQPGRDVVSEKPLTPGSHSSSFRNPREMKRNNKTESMTAMKVDGAMNVKPVKSISSFRLKATVKKRKLQKSHVKGTGADAFKEAEGVYCNVLSPSSTSIAVSELAAFLLSHDNEFFTKQFNAIPVNKDATTEVALSAENKMKNRYKDTCAYDHSRVRLWQNEEKKQEDYINACYIDGYKADEKFIASQGPTQIILDDFVRMLWEQSVEKVVMLTNLEEGGTVKCERYWPEDNEMDVGEIKIKLTTTHVFADYTIRRLRLQKAGEPAKKVTHFHFTTWPDKDVPLAPWGLVDFEQRVASYPSKAPIVVHCSAGVGRTGTFIALRNAMREAEDTGRIDFFAAVQKLRVNRVKMVQTAEQYKFLHRAALVAMVCMGTTVTAHDVQERIETLERVSGPGQTNMEKEFTEICHMCEHCEDDNTETDPADESNNTYFNYSRDLTQIRKNRFKNNLPKNSYRVHLMCEDEDMGDYINAVFVPSFCKHDQQILTELPLPTTVVDFWQLVTQYKVSLIVAFDVDPRERDSTIGDYMPTEKETSAKFQHFDIQAGPACRQNLLEERQLFIASANKTKLRQKSHAAHLDERQQVTHLQCSTLHHDPVKLLTLAREIRSRRPPGDGRIVYMCRNGADFSGLLCVVLLLLDRMDNDHRLTVPLVVGAVKTIKPQVIPTLAQYRLLYQVLKLYTDITSIYNN